MSIIKPIIKKNIWPDVAQILGRRSGGVYLRAEDGTVLRAEDGTPLKPESTEQSKNL